MLSIQKQENMLEKEEEKVSIKGMCYLKTGVETFAPILGSADRPGMSMSHE